MLFYSWKLAAFCQDMNKVLRVVSDSWVMYGAACRLRGGQYRASLIWHTRGRSICNMLIHSHACSPTRMHPHALPLSLRVRWPDRSPRLRAITGQKWGGTTGTEHLIMSASAVFVTQTAGRCYWGPGNNGQCNLCNPTRLWWPCRKESWTDRISLK